MAEDTVAAVSAIFAEAGWRPMPAPPRAGLFCAESSGGYWLGGIAPNGAVHSSHTHMTDPPQDAETIARNLVAAEARKYRFKRKATETVLPPPRIVLDEPKELEEDSGDELAEQPSGPTADSGRGEFSEGHDFSDEECVSVGVEDASGRDVDATIDADFSEPAPELGQELAEEHPEEFGGASGPIAYAASDLDSLVREKMGRLGQIARNKKAALQEGWTLEEFRFLQGLVVRMDRGEAPDDQTKRDRFVYISEQSRAMSRIEAFRDEREGVLDLIGSARDYAGAQAFDPEAGWPQ